MALPYSQNISHGRKVLPGTNLMLYLSKA